jgi:DNA invertase Pin-like site-specific DNA recombinase
MAERTRDGLVAARDQGRTGGQWPKLSPRQARIAQDMYDQTGPDGRRADTVAEIVSEFGVSPPPSTATSSAGAADRRRSESVDLGRYETLIMGTGCERVQRPLWPAMTLVT